MTLPQFVDHAWCVANPLPTHKAGTDKNSRGRVLLAGGSALVPGALRLTGEAVLRAGAGKLQMATPGSVAPLLGLHVPEAAVISLPTDGDGEISETAADILRDAIARCDTFALGPGMSPAKGTEKLLKQVLGEPRRDLSILLDAAAISCSGHLADLTTRHGGRIVMTPHYGEMAKLTGLSADQISRSPQPIAIETARRFNAIIALKADETMIAGPDGAMLQYGSDCVGLATGGSGDVLAGIIAGLMSRGASPIVATGWGVWLHGEAGRSAASDIGPLGFMARDLVSNIPRLMGRA
jgi:ADP-dependent NAD(P)H-hydrate dehydratase